MRLAYLIGSPASALAISATLAAGSTFSGTLALRQPVSATLQAASSLSSALTIRQPLAATLSASSSLSASVRSPQQLAAMLASSSSLSVSLGIGQPISVSLAAGSGLSATLGEIVSLSAILASGSGLSATISGVTPAGPVYFRANLVAFLNTLGVTVYPGRIPQRATLPAITFLQIDGDRLHQLSGPSGIAIGRYQITVSSTRYADCEVISEQLRGFLDRVQFWMGTSFVGAAILGNQLDKYDAPSSANDKGVHHLISEYTFRYEESFTKPVTPPNSGGSMFSSAFFPPSYFPKSYFP